MEFEYTTTLGKKLKIKPVSPYLLNLVGGTIPIPVIPTYTIEIKLPDGTISETETFAHDVKTKKTADEKRAWTKYLADLREYNDAVYTKRIRAVVEYAVIVDIPDDGWDKLQETRGVEVPTDPVERRFHYIMTECCTPTDIEVITSNRTDLMFINKELVAAAEKSFRDQMAAEVAGSEHTAGGA